MATSADRDEDEKKDDERAEDEESAKEKGTDEHAGVEKDEHAGEKAAAATQSPGKTTAKEHDEDEEEDEEEEDEEEEKPAPKPAAKRAATKGARGPGAGRTRPKPAKPGGGSLGKSVLLFFVIVVGLAAGFALLNREPTTPVIKWKTGDTVDVEITLVRSDRQDLSCASTEEVGGKHCAFETSSKPWTKGDVGDDKKLLKPYTTIDRIQFTAAGLWSEPALSPDKLPASRFSVKCKYKVEGNLKDVGVRWDPSAQWYTNKDWYAGSVSNCALVP